MPDAPANKAGFFIFEAGSQEVRFWHKADIEGVAQCPLSGVKQTSKFEAAMSAFDPQRTLHPNSGVSEFFLNAKTL